MTGQYSLLWYDTSGTRMARRACNICEITRSIGEEGFTKDEQLFTIVLAISIIIGAVDIRRPIKCAY